jgi:hypothetical protein
VATLTALARYAARRRFGFGLGIASENGFVAT